MAERRRRSRITCAPETTLLQKEEVAPIENHATFQAPRSRRRSTQSVLEELHTEEPFVIESQEPITDYNETVMIPSYIGTVPSFAEQELRKQELEKQAQLDAMDTSLASYDRLFATETLPYPHALKTSGEAAQGMSPVVPFDVRTMEEPCAPNAPVLDPQWVSQSPAAYSPYGNTQQGMTKPMPQAGYQNAPTNRYVSPSNQERPAVTPPGYAPHPMTHETTVFDQNHWVGIALKGVIAVGFLVVVFLVYQVLTSIQNNQEQIGSFSGNNQAVHSDEGVTLLPPGQTYAPTLSPTVVQTPTPSPIIQLAS